MSMVLDSYTFPYDPEQGTWTGIYRQKSRSELATATSVVVFNWGFPDYYPLIMKWPAMPKTMFETLRGKWEANGGANTYTYTHGTSSSFKVEIVELTGTPFGPAATFDWLVDITLTLKVLAKLT